MAKLTRIFLLIMGVAIVALCLIGKDFSGNPLSTWRRAVGTGGGMFFVYLGLMGSLPGGRRPQPGPKSGGGKRR